MPKVKKDKVHHQLHQLEVQSLPEAQKRSREIIADLEQSPAVREYKLGIDFSTEELHNLNKEPVKGKLHRHLNYLLEDRYNASTYLANTSFSLNEDQNWFFSIDRYEDFKLILLWLAHQGHAESQYILSRYYAHLALMVQKTGVGSEQLASINALTIHWLKQAAKQDNEQAQQTLLRYFEKNHHDYHPSREEKEEFIMGFLTSENPATKEKAQALVRFVKAERLKELTDNFSKLLSEVRTRIDKEGNRQHWMLGMQTEIESTESASSQSDDLEDNQESRTPPSSLVVAKPFAKLAESNRAALASGKNTTQQLRASDQKVHLYNAAIMMLYQRLTATISEGANYYLENIKSAKQFARLEKFIKDPDFSPIAASLEIIGAKVPTLEQDYSLALSRNLRVPSDIVELHIGVGIERLRELEQYVRLITLPQMVFALMKLERDHFPNEHAQFLPEFNKLQTSLADLAGAKKQNQLYLSREIDAVEKDLAAYEKQIKTAIFKKKYDTALKNLNDLFHSRNCFYLDGELNQTEKPVADELRDKTQFVKSVDALTAYLQKGNSAITREQVRTTLVSRDRGEFVALLLTVPEKFINPKTLADKIADIQTDYKNLYQQKLIKAFEMLLRQLVLVSDKYSGLNESVVRANKKIAKSVETFRMIKALLMDIGTVEGDSEKIFGTLTITPDATKHLSNLDPKFLSSHLLHFVIDAIQAIITLNSELPNLVEENKQANVKEDEETNDKLTVKILEITQNISALEKAISNHQTFEALKQHEDKHAEHIKKLSAHLQLLQQTKTTALQHQTEGNWTQVRKDIATITTQIAATKTDLAAADKLLKQDKTPFDTEAKQTIAAIELDIQKLRYLNINVDRLQKELDTYKAHYESAFLVENIHAAWLQRINLKDLLSETSREFTKNCGIEIAKAQETVLIPFAAINQVTQRNPSLKKKAEKFAEPYAEMLRTASNVKVVKPGFIRSTTSDIATSVYLQDPTVSFANFQQHWDRFKSTHETCEKAFVGFAKENGIKLPAKKTTSTVDEEPVTDIPTQGVPSAVTHSKVSEQPREFTEVNLEKTDLPRDIQQQFSKLEGELKQARNLSDSITKITQPDFQTHFQPLADFIEESNQSEVNEESRADAFLKDDTSQTKVQPAEPDFYNEIMADLDEFEKLPQEDKQKFFKQLASNETESDVASPQQNETPSVDQAATVQQEEKTLTHSKELSDEEHVKQEIKEEPLHDEADKFKRLEEEERIAREEEDRRKLAEEARKRDEQRRIEEEEQIARAEEARLLKEQEAQKREQELKLEEERRVQEELERKLQEQQQMEREHERLRELERLQAEEARRIEEEQQKRKAEELKLEEERKREAEETRKLEAEQERKREEERIKLEEERKAQEEQERMQLEATNLLKAELTKQLTPAVLGYETNRNAAIQEQLTSEVIKTDLLASYRTDKENGLVEQIVQQLMAGERSDLKKNLEASLTKLGNHTKAISEQVAQHHLTEEKEIFNKVNVTHKTAISYLQVLDAEIAKQKSTLHNTANATVANLDTIATTQEKLTQVTDEVKALREDAQKIGGLIEDRLVILTQEPFATLHAHLQTAKGLELNVNDLLQDLPFIDAEDAELSEEQFVQKVQTYLVELIKQNKLAEFKAVVEKIKESAPVVKAQLQTRIEAKQVANAEKTYQAATKDFQTLLLSVQVIANVEDKAIEDLYNQTTQAVDKKLQEASSDQERIKIYKEELQAVHKRYREASLTTLDEKFDSLIKKYNWIRQNALRAKVQLPDEINDQLRAALGLKSTESLADAFSSANMHDRFDLALVTLDAQQLQSKIASLEAALIKTTHVHAQLIYTKLEKQYDNIADIYELVNADAASAEIKAHEEYTKTRAKQYAETTDADKTAFVVNESKALVTHIEEVNQAVQEELQNKYGELYAKFKKASAAAKEKMVTVDDKTLIALRADLGLSTKAEDLFVVPNFDTVVEELATLSSEEFAKRTNDLAARLAANTTTLDDAITAKNIAQARLDIEKYHREFDALLEGVTVTDAMQKVIDESKKHRQNYSQASTLQALNELVGKAKDLVGALDLALLEKGNVKPSGSGQPVIPGVGNGTNAKPDLPPTKPTRNPNTQGGTNEPTVPGQKEEPKGNDAPPPIQTTRGVQSEKKNGGTKGKVKVKKPAPPVPGQKEEPVVASKQSSPISPTVNSPEYKKYDEMFAQKMLQNLRSLTFYSPEDPHWQSYKEERSVQGLSIDKNITETINLLTNPVLSGSRSNRELAGYFNKAIQTKYGPPLGRLGVFFVNVKLAFKNTFGIKENETDRLDREWLRQTTLTHQFNKIVAASKIDFENAQTEVTKSQTASQPRARTTVANVPETTPKTRMAPQIPEPEFVTPEYTAPTSNYDRHRLFATDSTRLKEFNNKMAAIFGSARGTNEKIRDQRSKILTEKAIIENANAVYGEPLFKLTQKLDQIEKELMEYQENFLRHRETGIKITGLDKQKFAEGMQQLSTYQSRLDAIIENSYEILPNFTNFKNVLTVLMREMEQFREQMDGKDKVAAKKLENLLDQVKELASSKPPHRPDFIHEFNMLNQKKLVALKQEFTEFQKEHNALQTYRMTQ